MAPHIMNPYRFGGANMSDTDLKAYWKFNEASGDIINQSASAADLGSGADGQNTGMTYVSTGGDSPFDYEGNFTATDDVVVFGSSLSQFNFMHNTTGLFTLNFWLKLTAIDVLYQIFSTMSDTGLNIGVSLYTTTTEAMEIVIWNGSAALPLVFASSGSYVPDTSYHMYTITWDQSLGSNNLTIKRDNANTENGTKTAGTPSSSNAQEAGRIGLRSDSTRDLNGKICEVSLWNRILTADEITALYNAGSGMAIY